MASMALIRIAALSDLGPGVMITGAAGGTHLVLCNHNGTIHAFADRCPHRNGPLSQGNFVDGRLICPWHAWEFRCDTGCYDYNPAIELQRFPVVIQGEDVFVDA
ncbi:MAG: Rieske 2Fe-2S domain-containing protein [Acidobacteria bacterium]|nr:Rieske 2Fe-2S domain-containing protein [Acidobacteriota bacterium]